MKGKGPEQSGRGNGKRELNDNIEKIWTKRVLQKTKCEIKMNMIEKKRVITAKAECGKTCLVRRFTQVCTLLSLLLLLIVRNLIFKLYFFFF